MMSSMIHEAANRLMAGHEGSAVVEYLRQELHASAQRGGRDFSVNTLKNYVSRTKAYLLDREFRNPHCDFSLLQASNDPDVRDFLAAPLKRQIQIQRRHRGASFESTWSEMAPTTFFLLGIRVSVL